MAVAGTSVEVDETGVKVGGDELSVGKASIEKVQALSNSGLNAKIIIGSNHLPCFIASSLSVVGIPSRNSL